MGETSPEMSTRHLRHPGHQNKIELFNLYYYNILLHGYFYNNITLLESNKLFSSTRSSAGHCLCLMLGNHEVTSTSGIHLINQCPLPIRIHNMNISQYQKSYCKG